MLAFNMFTPIFAYAYVYRYRSNFDQRISQLFDPTPTEVMLGGAVGAGAPGEGDLLTVTVVRDEHGYGMKVSGDNPVYVQSVKEHGAAWRAGLRSGDRILRVDAVPVHHHTHQQVVHMIRANPTTVLTVQQNSSRHKTPITAPVPVNSEKQRQLEASKVHTVRLMLEKEQKYIRDLRNELLKVPDVRKQAQLESSEQRCATLQHEIDAIMAGQVYTDMISETPEQPSTPRLSARVKSNLDKLATGSPPPNNSTGFLSGLPRSLSNLTGQSLRNLRQARQNKLQQENQPPLVRQNSDETNNKRRHVHNNTVPIVPTTCLDNTPPPLPPRSIERPKRNPLSPTISPSPVNPLAKPKPSSSVSPLHKQYYKGKPYPMHQSMPNYRDDPKLRRSSHSLDGELDGPQPNSIALQMSYPLVNAPPPPLQTDNRTGVPILHVRSQSSPEHLDHELPRASQAAGAAWERGTPPPGTPPPPYAHNTQPCADPQRAIISMEEDDSPASDNSTYSGLFSNLRSVRESKARTAVLLNWLLGERRCACASLLLVLTDAYRAATGAPAATLRRWAYEIQSTFLMPNAVLQLNGVDENMANEIEHVLVNEYEKEELLRNVFRKARLQAKEELARQLSEFQVKRQVGLGSLYGPDDAVLERCDVDRAQEQVVVERLMCQQLSALARGAGGCGGAPHPDAHASLLAALVAAAHSLHCRPASVAAAVGGSRASFLQRDKLYKQRVKQLTKQHPQPFVVRGHHLQLQALTAVAHCHHCDLVIAGLAPQAYVCTDCKLRVHRACAKSVEESCCLDGEQHHNNRISRFMERIHHQQTGLDSSDKKSRKASGNAHFLNMERSFRKMEDEQPWDQTLTPASALERRDESDESLYESADCHSDAISASDDALPRLGKTPTMSKESLKLAVTDEETDLLRSKKGHRKTMSLSNPLEMVKSLGDDWFDSKKDLEKHSDKKKSRESLWSEEDRDSIHGSTLKLDQIRKNSKKDDKLLSESRKSSTADVPKRKSSKGSSVSALNFLRRKKTPTSMKAVEAVVEAVDRFISSDEILKHTKFFLEEEKRHAAICNKPPAETDSEEDVPNPKLIGEHRRRLSRQTSRSKSKVRGKSQTVKVNTLRKSHSGTLKKAKKKGTKTPLAGRSRQASIVEPSPMVKKKNSDAFKQNSWLFSSSRAESRREGSTEEPSAPDLDLDTSDTTTKELPEKEHNWRGAVTNRGVNRAESCRERDAPRRGKHRNASDPNRLTAHHNHDLEPGAATAPSGSSSSSSLSSRSNESNTVAAEQQASQSDWSEEEEPLAAQWADSLPPQVLDSLLLPARIRKRQEVIHELIVSEGSHVRWLKVLGSVFLRPLEAAPALLPAEELRALFPNLPGVRERHARLYAELRAARTAAAASGHLVSVRPVADAMLNMLGEAGYAACLSRFCRGQRMALDALRERRRKNKELHQFLAGREQLPLCGRLQLRDLLACVWQRLTKYQLLLEGILKTVCEEGSPPAEGEGEPDSAEDAAQLRRAVATAKDVLHAVDTAIRTAENHHRLKTIQSKLEVRVGSSMGGEWDELRRLDLASHSLRLEGELAVRSDGNKRTAVLALMLEEALVLLQREGDKFILRPMGPGQPGQLSPVIKWDKVLFRPNAAVKNTFFLMNINGVQMHELSANTSAEYSTWVKHIQEAPLAKLTELKPSLTPSHQHTRSTDDSGINVSRNPSDASSTSSSGAQHYEPERERERERLGTPVERDGDVPSTDADAEAEAGAEADNEHERERESDRDKDVDSDMDSRQQRATVGRISTHSTEGAPALEPASALRVREPAARAAHTAHRAYTHQERLRRLDEAITRALRAKSAVVAEILGVPAHSYAQVAELAVAETMGHDVGGDRARSDGDSAPDIHQLLLAAQAQASQLTAALSAALAASDAAAVAARAGRCGACARPRRDHAETPEPPADPTPPTPELGKVDAAHASLAHAHAVEWAGDNSIDLLESYDMLPDFGHTETTTEPPFDEATVWSGSAARLASSLLPVAGGLRAALAGLATAVPAALAERHAARDELRLMRERCDRTRHEYQMTEDLSFPKGNVDQSVQDQPSNGG